MVWGPLAVMGLNLLNRAEAYRQGRLANTFDRRMAEADGPHAFVSYSRTETPLVEDLVDGLHASEIKTFVDFRSLEPGTPWDQGLESAIHDASAVILVVSDRSVVGSPEARREWQQALEQDKRVVLAIAEPVALPDELKHKEWIDLRRGRFHRNVAELARLIADPAEPPGPPPTSERRRPGIVWLAVGLAALTAILSIPLVWTIAIPLVLIPLPVRIVRRNFVYQRARLALFGEVSVLSLLSDELFYGEWAVFPDAELLSWVYLLTVLTIPSATLLVLRSRSFRRWMTPRAARPRMPVLPAIATEDKPAPQHYVLERSSEDAAYVREVADAFKEQGHTDVTPVEPAGGLNQPVVEPDIYVRFVSRFNDTAEVSTGALTLPILISDPDDELPPNLRRTQWLDIRHGGRLRRRREAQHLAFWLDRPRDLLRPLGAAPSHGTKVLPRGVQALHDLLWACLVLVFAVVFTEIVYRPASLAAPQWAAFLITVVAFVALAARTLRRLTERQPTAAWSLYVPFLVGLFFLLTTILVGFEDIQYILADNPDPQLSDPRGAQVASFAQLYGACIVFPIGWLLTRSEAAMWIPSSSSHRTTDP